MTNEQLRAFEQVYSDYYSRIYKRVYALMHHAQDAEDLTQETFMKLYRAFTTLDTSNLYAWLYRVATNAVYDVLRQRRHRSVTSLDADGLEWIDAQSGDVQEDYTKREALHIALSGLSEMQRNTLLLQVQGYQVIEVAVYTGQTRSAVNSTLRRARHAFKQHYEGATAS